MTKFVRRPASAIAEACKVTWTDPETGYFSVSRFIPVIACGILSAAFMKNAAKFDLTWDDYIGYAVAVTVSASPSLVRDYLKMRFGGQQNGQGGAS